MKKSEAFPELPTRDRDTKTAHAFRKMARIDLLNVGLSEIFSWKQKMQYL